MAQGAEQTRVLEFWRMVELFTPQTLPKLERRSPDHKVVPWHPGDPLPWDALPPAKPKKVWQHDIYLGVYELAHIYETLRKLFVQDPDAHDLRVPGRSACAGLVVNNDGLLVGESVVLSSCAWALGEVNAGRHSRPGWADLFENGASQFQEAVTEQDAQRQEGAGSEDPLPVDENFLGWLHNSARAMSHLSDVASVPCDAIVIRSKQVYESTAADLSDFDFMNSFFLEDLRVVQQAVAHGDSGYALTQYMTPASELDVTRRIDVVAAPEAVEARTGAETTPPGRWPSKPKHPLALSQQFAVNCALDGQASANGLMGVNGPPGTGKTTLLRDLIAGNVVERARRLAVLTHPREAFTEDIHRWKSGDWPRKVPQLRPELTGFEMVVASANNAAVENVTEEIPAANAIEEPWAGGIDHFTDLANRILKRGQQTPSDTAPVNSPDHETDETTRTAPADAAWGLIAAKLGNMSNRGTFVSTFWFGKGGDGPDQGMSHILTEWAKEPHESWQSATTAFEDAAARVEALRGERVSAEQRLARRISIRTDMEEASAALDLAAQEADRAAALLPHIERDLSARGNEEQHAEHARQRHLEAKPSALETFFTLGAASRRWRADLTPLDAQLQDREQARTALEGHLHSSRQAAAQASERRQGLLNRCAALSDESRELVAALARDADKYGPSYPGVDWTGDARELTAPWLDAAYNEARSDLFIAALDLHRAFIRHLAGDMKSWMSAACDVIQGKAPRTLPPEATLAAWQLFSFFVPVVSTTFASMARMFRGQERESLGWLLIDEAGQCSPQQAAGAIWRAKRVIAVGDPMQLQPVVPIPPKAINDMAHTYGVDDLWIPPAASVQTLTDRTSIYGTTLHNQAEPVWVSSPLRVHRRCDDPMFSVSNQVAYDGLMISAVHRPPAEQDPFKRSPPAEYVEGGEREQSHPEVPIDSYWDDVPAAATSDSHLQPQEIERARAAVAYLHDRCGIPYEQIFAVSPFRAVANALRRIADEHPGMRGGTVHTAQGREADVVLLVLGTSTARGGARAWAASTPNLLNVAASRARRRLYVFGDYDNWSEQKYFTTLAHQLPRRRRSTSGTDQDASPEGDAR